jgi:hypothetical protein
MAKKKTETTAKDSAIETFEATDYEGRKWILRPLPAHFFVMFGELPAEMTEKAVNAMKDGKDDVLGAEVLSRMSQKQIVNSLMMMREAVKYGCVKPRIVLSPETADEISPFEVSEKSFNFLAKTIMKGSGGLAEGLDSFRGEPGQTA